ncbi:MAG: 23S rRNA (pseudouridine(1915)-N(3))-methyltransferase RlmH [Bacilli bacterium]
MNLKIICVGRLKEAYWRAAIAEYTKRLSGYKINIIEVKSVNTDDVNKNILLEGEAISKNIMSDDYVIALEVEGKIIDSETFASDIKTHYLYSAAPITFVIGGSDGLSADIKSRANSGLSFGRMTYPHQLMRVILLEQLYRAMMINSNRSYHK